MQSWLVHIGAVLCMFFNENQSHNCTVTDRVANCSRRYLSEIPSDLPSDIISLNLEKNLISNIPDGVFSNYSFLNSLNLYRNDIVLLGDNVFKGLEQLEALSLRKNLLNISSSFCPNVFSPLRKLKILDLSDNMINPQSEITYPYFGDLQNLVQLKIDLVPQPNFEKSKFHKLKKLERLEFKNCRLKHLKNNTFSTVYAPIQILSISGCTIMKTVEANAISPFSNLSSLELSSCCLTLEQAFTLLYPFRGKKMERIDLLNVNSGLCNGPIENPFAVIVTRKMMQNLQNICLKHITMNNNGIVDFEPHSLLVSNYPECFSSITIQNNNFCVANGFKGRELAILFTKLINLTSLEFSGSEKSLPIERDRKPQNNNEDYSIITFPPRLKNVTLSSTNAGVFINKLKFLNATSLEYLNLSYYRMTNFPEISFSGENKIAFIDISGIPSWLYADRIGLRLFNTTKEVVINNARLSQTINEGKNIFSLFPSIRKLNISNNLLWRIPKGFFQSNVNLTFLDIRRNLLREIPLSVTELPRLTHLTLQNNVILTINSTLRGFFDRQREKMKSFELHLFGNIFKCSCENRDFIRWLFQTKVVLDKRNFFRCQLQNGTIAKVKEVYKEYNQLFSDCDAPVWLRVGIVMLVAFVIFSIPIALVVNFRWRIALWIFRFFKRTIEKEIRSFEYDVYLSCAEDSLTWANDTLIGKMQGEWGLKIFFEERDVAPGNFPLIAISEGITDSRNIVFIVSEQFNQREWSAFEIRCAMYEKFCRTLQRIIVISRDIDVNQFPVQLGHIIRDIYIVNWIDGENELNFDKLKTLVDNDIYNMS